MLVVKGQFLLLLLATCHTQIPAEDDHRGHCTPSKDMSELVSFLTFVQMILNDAQKNCQKNSDQPIDCADGDCKNFLSITPRSRVTEGPFNVSCDSDDDGGGWTVIQRRGDFNSAVDYFYRDWNSYKQGFGNIKEDFWIGNDNLYTLTNQRACTLKIVMSDWEGNTTYASYDDFWIDDESHNYKLHISGYRGTAGDSFTSHNGAAFTTKDRKNDDHGQNCAEQFKGAWWYYKCHTSNLNGQYLKGEHESFADGVNWLAFRGYKYSLKETVMKIRPKKYSKVCKPK